jgi:hypothetical protein
MEPATIQDPIKGKELQWRQVATEEFEGGCIQSYIQAESNSNMEMYIESLCNGLSTEDTS